MGTQMIGQRNTAQEKQALLQSTVRVLEDVKSIHLDIYKSVDRYQILHNLQHIS